MVDINFDLLFGTDPSRCHRGAESGPVDSNRVLEFGNPNLVLMDRIADPAAVQFFDRHEAWVRLYSDGCAILWGQTVFDDPSLASCVAVHCRRLFGE